jgi:hypothetical protein
MPVVLPADVFVRKLPHTHTHTHSRTRMAVCDCTQPHVEPLTFDGPTPPPPPPHTHTHENMHTHAHIPPTPNPLATPTPTGDFPSPGPSSCRVSGDQAGQQPVIGYPLAAAVTYTLSGYVGPPGVLSLFPLGSTHTPPSYLLAPQLPPPLSDPHTHTFPSPSAPLAV